MTHICGEQQCEQGPGGGAHDLGPVLQDGRGQAECEGARGAAAHGQAITAGQVAPVGGSRRGRGGQGGAGGGGREE